MARLRSSRDPGLPEKAPFSDCRICTEDGGDFWGHRAFLCTTSPFFGALFSEDYGDRREVVLRGVALPTLNALVSFYYTDELRVKDGDDMVRLLDASDMLLMEAARDEGLAQLLHTMEPDNCLGIAELAVTRFEHCKSFCHAALSYVRKHFREVWPSSDEFLHTSPGLLHELLSSDELNIRDEVDVLYALHRWSSGDHAGAAGDSAIFSSLLECVRLGRIGARP
ncbi:kelch-like protein 20 [Haemaphysalis longicornis]